MDSVIGDFQFPGAASSTAARAHIEGDCIRILAVDDERLLKNSTLLHLAQGMIIPGLAVDIQFADGSLFTPRDSNFRWPKAGSRGDLATTLETNRLAIAISMVGLVFATWLMIAKVIPSAAVATAKLLPTSVQSQMGKQTLSFLERVFLNPSELTTDQQASAEQAWDKLKDDIASDDFQYSLNFYKSPAMGANAFALPDGTVVVTDELIELLADKPDALIAVLLHEIGHVENQHGVQLVAQSLGITFVFAALFGDLEGATELFLGAGGSLLQNAFSRDMEREADAFAITNLEQLGIARTAFADAIREISQGSPSSGSSVSLLEKYLSSHPDPAERIQAAEHKPQDD